MGVLSGFKTRRVTHCLETKLGIDFGAGKENNGWYCIGGKKILRVTLPKQHGGNSLSKNVARRVIGSLRLTNNEFRNLYNCPMKGTDYRRKIDELVNQGVL